MFARQSTGLLLTLCGDYAAAALVQPLALEQARQLGARRYEAIILAHQAEATLALNGRDEARALAEQAVALSRDTGAGFCGPLALSVLARATDDPSTRAAALREGAAILAGGCVSHNHFWFHRNAIELALQGRDWDEIDRHADALAAYTQAERLPFSDLLAAWAADIHTRRLAEGPPWRGSRGSAASREEGVEAWEQIANHLTTARPTCAWFAANAPRRLGLVPRLSDNLSALAKLRARLTYFESISPSSDPGTRRRPEDH